MSQPTDNQKEIAKAKYIVSVPIQDIASEIGVNRRTIERWAADGDWRSLRQSASPTTNIVSFQKPKLASRPPEFIGRKERFDLDDIDIIEAAIAELHASLPSCEDKSKGGIAGALARLIDLKRKIKPDTVADLVERAIELGIGPDELLRELRESWARRA